MAFWVSGTLRLNAPIAVLPQMLPGPGVGVSVAVGVVVGVAVSGTAVKVLVGVLQHLSSCLNPPDQNLTQPLDQCPHDELVTS